MEIRHKDILLRDMVESDIEDEVRWFTVQTEWMRADTPWEELETIDPAGLRAELREMLKQEPQGMRSRLEIVHDGKHIGFVSAYRMKVGTDNCCGVGIEICEPELWGRGIGTSALEAFIKYISEHIDMDICLETWSGNMRMLGCARKLGFEECAREKDAHKVDDKLYDQIVMRKARS